MSRGEGCSRLVGLVGIFRVLLVGGGGVFLVDQLFQRASTRLNRLNKHVRDYVASS